MYSSLMIKLLFDYQGLTKEEISEFCVGLPKKMLRWLGENHPDNKTRKIFFELTGVRIGDDSVINKNLIISDNYKPLLFIGNRVAVSPNVIIICASAPNNSDLNKNEYVNKNLIVEKEVIIEDNVWIGAGSIILPGVTIGKNSVIGAGSVVSKSIEPNSIVTGTPAKKIRDLIE
jgi:acetyltransferase-like isoleucine patch superfamily enzyme